MEPIGQDVDGIGGVGIGRRIGRRILGASEDVALGHAERRAVSQQQSKPLFNRATRLARDAESDLEIAVDAYETACADLIRGVGDEAAVEDAERAVDALERQRRRMRAAAAVLGEDLGLIRDSSGVQISR